MKEASQSGQIISYDPWQNEAETRRTCMLLVSLSCNLNCTYCYEEFKCGKKMTFEMARDIILKECEIVKADPKFSGLEIDFMGGEPMTNFPLIKQVVEWARGLPLSVPYIFFMTTNGTLFDEEAKAWFCDNADIICASVSYDGSDDMQQANRGVAASAVDYDFFHATWPFQPFHVTISKQSLKSLAENIMAMHKKGWKINAALASGIDWDNDDVMELTKQLEGLRAFYLANPQYKPINLLTPPLFVQKPDATESFKQEKFCGCGVYMQTYDVDGKAYGCHMFTPIVLGERAFEASTVDWKCEDSVVDPFCSTCVLKRICHTCSGFNFKYRGSLAIRDHRACRMVLAEMKAAAALQLDYLAEKRDHLMPKDVMYAKALLGALPVLDRIDLAKAQPPFNIK